MDAENSSCETGRNDTQRLGVDQRDVFEGLGNLRRLGVLGAGSQPRELNLNRSMHL